MSVLIKGIEMPKSHPICVVIDTAGQARKYDLNNDRYEDNKLFEVNYIPPHGRCIDVDALIKELAIDDSDDYNGATLLMAIFLEVLKAAPTIIPAEEEET